METFSASLTRHPNEKLENVVRIGRSIAWKPEWACGKIMSTYNTDTVERACRKNSVQAGRNAYNNQPVKENIRGVCREKLS